MISAKNISVSVHQKKLLQDVSIDVVPGLLTAVAGPNGAGKTSLLKVLSGETNRYMGDVEVNGSSLKRLSASELSAVRAVLPQSSQLQFHFPVQQIVAMGLQNLKYRQPQIKNILKEVMELTGTLGWSERDYLTLSGGEQQRVQLARVLAQVWEIRDYPRYILLDEPTSSLDIAQQQVIFNLSKQSCERNIGVLAIVHDLNQAVQYADQLYFLKEGKTTAEGQPKKIFTKRIIEETFCCPVNVYHDPCTDCPYFVPDTSTQSILKPEIV